VILDKIREIVSISIKREKESKIRLEIKEKNYFCENNDKKTRKRENVPFS
jgi:hypothetical protein